MPTAQRPAPDCTHTLSHSMPVTRNPPTRSPTWTTWAGAAYVVAMEAKANFGSSATVISRTNRPPQAEAGTPGTADAAAGGLRLAGGKSTAATPGLSGAGGFSGTRADGTSKFSSRGPSRRIASVEVKAGLGSALDPAAGRRLAATD